MSSLSSSSSRSRNASRPVMVGQTNRSNTSAAASSHQTGGNHDFKAEDDDDGAKPSACAQQQRPLSSPSAASAASAAAAAAAPPPIRRRKRRNRRRGCRQQVGTAGTFLARIVDNDGESSSSLLKKMIGSPPPTTAEANEDDELLHAKQLQLISDFLRDHRLATQAAAAAAASQSSLSSSSSPDAPSPACSPRITTTAPYYLPTVRDFAQRQIERQAAGLWTHTMKNNHVPPASSTRDDDDDDDDDDDPPTNTSPLSMRIIQCHQQALTTALGYRQQEEETVAPSSTTNTDNGDNNGNPNSNTHLYYLSNHERLCQLHALLCAYEEDTDANNNQNDKHGQETGQRQRRQRKVGCYRTTGARASSTYFCPSDQIETEMKHLFQAVERLYSHYCTTVQQEQQEQQQRASYLVSPTTTSPSSSSNQQQQDDKNETTTTYMGLVLAAAVLAAVNDIHPFEDGNGRLARLLCNCVLQKVLGLPFCVTLTATVQQRHEYIGALRQSDALVQRFLARAVVGGQQQQQQQRHDNNNNNSNNEEKEENSNNNKKEEEENDSKVKSSNSSNSSNSNRDDSNDNNDDDDGDTNIDSNNNNNNNNGDDETAVVVPPFQPIVHLILDRVAHAIQELQSLLHDQARQAADSERNAILRHERERAVATGQCIICLDQHPNIATLCCGQAVHLKCLAEWLVAHEGSNCVNCRAPLPPMRSRMSLLSTTTTPAQTAARQAAAAAVSAAAFHVSPSLAGIQQLVNVIERTVDEQLLQSYNHAAAAIAAIAAAAAAAEEDTTTMTDVEEEEEEDVGQQQQDDDTSTEMIREGQRPQCSLCSNIRALDCDNGMCGRCCQAGYGAVTCARHGGEDTTTMTETNDYDDDDNTCSQCTNIRASDCDNGMCGRCCQAGYGSVTCARHGGAGAVDTEDTTTMTETDDYDDDNKCSQCTNIRASDCDNGMCGPCCQLAGRNACARHGVESRLCSQCFQNIRAVECDNAMCASCCQAGYGSSAFCERHGGVPQHQPTEDTTTTITTDDDEDTTTTNDNMIEYCSECNNRAALGCVNGMCGRCCGFMGRYFCCRHSG